MDEGHRELLRRHSLNFRKDLEPKKLLPYLVLVFDAADEQEIKNQITRQDQVDKLLDILPRRGQKAFSYFVEALEKVDVQRHLAVPLRQEEEMIEMKTELVIARSRSAKLRDELRSTSGSLESMKNKEENLRKQLEELKSLHKALLYQSNKEKENMNFNLNELNNLQMQLTKQLEMEKQEHFSLKTKFCALEKDVENKTKEIEKLKVGFQRQTSGFNGYSSKINSEVTEDMSNREVNNNIDVVDGQCEEILECMQDDAEIELENILLEVDKCTDTKDDEVQPCINCIIRESEYGELKQQMEKEISRLNEETRKVECTLKEMTDQYEREKKDLEANLHKREELYMTSKLDHENELKRIQNEMTEQHLNDVKEMKKAKEDLESQVENNNRTISRLKNDLDGEKDSNEAVRKEFDKYIEKSNSEKKDLKKKHEDEIKSKGLCLKKVETELKEAKEDGKKSMDNISKLKAKIREHQDIQEQLKKELASWKMQSGRVFNYKNDFDRNGIVHFLGTAFNTKKFVNPASEDNCRMHVSRSSCDKGHPIDILDLKKGTVSCTNDEEHSWWQVEFGEEYALLATNYTLRHGSDNGLSIIRNWNLEGSHDGRHWKVLRKHENDRGMKGDYPFYTGSWTVEGRIESMRYFRIQQTGKNSAGRYALYLSGFEIYGVLLGAGVSEQKKRHSSSESMR